MVNMKLHWCIGCLSPNHPHRRNKKTLGVVDIKVKTSNLLVPLFRGQALNPPPWKLFLKINTAVHNVQCPLLSQIASIQLFWVFQFCLRSSWKYSVNMDARPPHVSFLLLGHVFLLLQLASPAQIGFTHTQYSLVISSSFCFLPSSCTLYNGMNLLQFKPHNYLRLLNIPQDPWGNAASIARAIELLSSGQVVTNHGDGEDGDGEDGHHHHHRHYRLFISGRLRTRISILWAGVGATQNHRRASEKYSASLSPLMIFDDESSNLST